MKIQPNTIQFSLAFLFLLDTSGFVKNELKTSKVIQRCAIFINKMQLLMKSFCFAPFKINWFLTCAAGNREMIFVGLIALYWCEQVHLWSSKSVLWLSIVLSRWNQAKWGHTCYTKPNHTREWNVLPISNFFCNRTTIIEREDFLPQAANQISVEGPSEGETQWVEILKKWFRRILSSDKIEIFCQATFNIHFSS